MEATIKKSNVLILTAAVFSLAVFLLMPVFVKAQGNNEISPLPALTIKDLVVKHTPNGAIKGSFNMVNEKPSSNGYVFNASYQINLFKIVENSKGTKDYIFVYFWESEKFPLKPAESKAFDFEFIVPPSIPSGKYLLNVSLPADFSLGSSHAVASVILKGTGHFVRILPSQCTVSDKEVQNSTLGLLFPLSQTVFRMQCSVENLSDQKLSLTSKIQINDNLLPQTEQVLSKIIAGPNVVLASHEKKKVVIDFPYIAGLSAYRAEMIFYENETPVSLTTSFRWVAGDIPGKISSFSLDKDHYIVGDIVQMTLAYISTPNLLNKDALINVAIKDGSTQKICGQLKEPLDDFFKKSKTYQLAKLGIKIDDACASPSIQVSISQAGKTFSSVAEILPENFIVAKSVANNQAKPPMPYFYWIIVLITILAIIAFILFRRAGTTVIFLAIFVILGVMMMPRAVVKAVSCCSVEYITYCQQAPGESCLTGYSINSNGTLNCAANEDCNWTNCSNSPSCYVPADWVVPIDPPPPPEDTAPFHVYLNEYSNNNGIPWETTNYGSSFTEGNGFFLHWYVSKNQSTAGPGAWPTSCTAYGKDNQFYPDLAPAPTDFTGSKNVQGGQQLVGTTLTEATREYHFGGLEGYTREYLGYIYGIKCSKGSYSETAETTVRPYKCGVELTANPTSVLSGGTSILSWITSAMIKSHQVNNNYGGHVVTDTMDQKCYSYKTPLPNYSLWADGALKNPLPIGSFSVQPTQDAIYELRCKTPAYDASSTCSAFVPISVTTNGVCGDAAHVYEIADTSWGSYNGKFCNPGTPSYPDPPFPPVPGTSIGWTCSGVGGGSSASCTASRKALVCGTANGHTYGVTDTSYGSYTQCDSGSPTSTAFPSPGDTKKWFCGENRFYSSECTAKRDPIVCGTANGRTFGSIENVTGKYTLCNSGVASTPTQSISGTASPAPGTSISWTCSSADNHSVSCFAKRAALNTCAANFSPGISVVSGSGNSLSNSNPDPYNSGALWSVFPATSTTSCILKEDGVDIDVDGTKICTYDEFNQLIGCITPRVLPTNIPKNTTPGTRNYILTCTPAAGSGYSPCSSATTTLIVNPAPIPCAASISLNPSPTIDLNYLNTAQLTWDATNGATFCSVQDNGATIFFAEKPPVGEEDFYPDWSKKTFSVTPGAGSHTYQINCSGGAGVANCNALSNVNVISKVSDECNSLGLLNASDCSSVQIGGGTCDQMKSCVFDGTKNVWSPCVIQSCNCDNGFQWDAPSSSCVLKKKTQFWWEIVPKIFQAPSYAPFASIFSWLKGLVK